MAMALSMGSHNVCDMYWGVGSEGGGGGWW